MFKYSDNKNLWSTVILCINWDSFTVVNVIEPQGIGKMRLGIKREIIEIRMNVGD